ncbi:Flagellar hook-length control protein FliK [Gemmata sp. SH-PL17]|nr:Flagellar hook-length control protein FliK [Gemmata sp. SH-PL17]
MHVPLSELGETWIDAGLAGDSFRAAIYLDRAAVRERVSAALPELHSELQTEGFGEVFLDVRAVADLPPRTRVQSSAMMSGRPAALASLLDVRV